MQKFIHSQLRVLEESPTIGLYAEDKISTVCEYSQGMKGQPCHSTRTEATEMKVTEIKMAIPFRR